MVWKCVHGVAPAYLSDLCVPGTAVSGGQRLQSAATGTLLVPCSQTATGQQSFAVNGQATCNPSATSTTVTGPVGEHLQTGTENAPVLDRPVPLRRFHDSGAVAPDINIQTYLLIYSQLHKVHMVIY